MASVYCVFLNYDCEGSDLEGVYATNAGATARKDWLEHMGYVDGSYCHSCTVKKMEVEP